MTKSDTFPLPRIDDLLDLLGDAKYFTTLDLASGYWQVKMAQFAKEKTAFVTHQGLHEFQVMPFGLRNAPSVFQRLMQRVLAGLNPENGPDYVSVYLDDILIFSRTLEDHLKHLMEVFKRLLAAGLKLKYGKHLTRWHFWEWSYEIMDLVRRHLLSPWLLYWYDKASQSIHSDFHHSTPGITS